MCLALSGSQRWSGHPILSRASDLRATTMVRFAQPAHPFRPPNLVANFRSRATTVVRFAQPAHPAPATQPCRELQISSHDRGAIRTTRASGSGRASIPHPFNGGRPRRHQRSSRSSLGTAVRSCGMTVIADPRGNVPIHDGANLDGRLPRRTGDHPARCVRDNARTGNPPIVHRPVHSVIPPTVRLRQNGRRASAVPNPSP